MKQLFLQLVNMSITAGWLILAVMALRLIFKRAPRWVFCLLWGFVGLRLVLPFSLESVFSLVPTKTPVNEVKNVVDRIVINANTAPLDLTVNTPPVTTLPDVNVVAPPDMAPAVKETLSLTEIFAIVWLCGLVALVGYAVVSYMLLRCKVRTAVRLENGVWQSEAVTSPFVLGLIKPRIYLPFSLDESDVLYVLAHERAHIFRRDHLIKPLGFMILAVYWFNPLIWIAYVLLCRDVELACDEKVIKSLDVCERRYYSTALLNCSVSRVRIAACPIAFGEVAVKERIKGVMNYKKPAFWIIILTVIAVIVTAVCFLTDPKEKEKEKEDDSPKTNDVEKTTEVDLKEYVDLLLKYTYLPSEKYDNETYLNKLYFAARFSYENKLSFVEIGEKSFTISRSDIFNVLQELTNTFYDERSRDEIDSCHKYLELYGDSYDPMTDEYTFVLDRKGWGQLDEITAETINPDGRRMVEYDTSKPIEIEKGSLHTFIATLWAKYPIYYGEPAENYYPLELTFSEKEFDDTTVYLLCGVEYGERPITETDISVECTQDTPTDGFYYTDFILKVGEREVAFNGKGWDESATSSISISRQIEYSDFTDDGVYDIAVILRSAGNESPQSENTYDMHVFDGVTLKEVPGLENIPQKVMGMIKTSQEEDSYTVEVNGKKNTIYKSWYDHDDEYFYDLPDLSTDFYVTLFPYPNDPQNPVKIRFELACAVSPQRSMDRIKADIVYSDGKFVIDGLSTSGFYRYSDVECRVHDRNYHGYDDELIGGYEAIEVWFAEMYVPEYNNNGCCFPENRCNYAIKVGLTEKDMRDEYYLSYDYYLDYPDPYPLFELDEEGCDAFFRNTDMSNLPVMKQRHNELEFKIVLVQLLNDSDTPIKRKAYYELPANVAHWSIPQLVYLSGMTLEEIEEIYSDFAMGKENLFEYDFGRLFSEREYFENLIETAEYPVFVDEALHK